MKSPEIVEGFKTCELFTALSDEEIEQLIAALAGACEIETYEAGDCIFEQGAYNSRLYIILDGQVLLKRSVNIGDRTAMWPMGLLGKSRAMGWPALLYGPRYVTVSAVCQKPTRLISLEGTSLRSLLEKDVNVGFKVMDRLACLLGDRLRTAYSTMETQL